MFLDYDTFTSNTFLWPRQFYHHNRGREGERDTQGKLELLIISASSRATISKAETGGELFYIRSEQAEWSYLLGLNLTLFLVFVGLTTLPTYK